MYRPLDISKTMMSNLYTMGISMGRDGRQNIPDTYIIPPKDVRELRAKLIMEEALETCEAMGVDVTLKVNMGEDLKLKDVIEDISLSMNELVFEAQPMDAGFKEQTTLQVLENIIDGCCDTIYVCTGTIVACGAYDDLHMKLVNEANNAKFPGGKATFNESGKFMKPEGWKPPDHKALIQSELLKDPRKDLRAIALNMVKEGICVM